MGKGGHFDGVHHKRIGVVEPVEEVVHQDVEMGWGWRNVAPDVYLCLPENGQKYFKKCQK